MSDVWQSTTIARFEYVIVDPAVALLRIRGETPPGAQAPEGRPTLVADDGRSVTRFAALPAPPDEPGEARAAYSVPAGLVRPGTGFSLELQDESTFALPTPTPGAARIAETGSTDTSAPSDGSAPPDRSVDPPREHERRSDILVQFAELSAALAQARRWASGLEAQRAAAEARAAEADAQVAASRERAAQAEAANQQLTSTLTELEMWRAELERRLAATTTELGDARTQLREYERGLDGMPVGSVETTPDAVPRPIADPGSAGEDGLGRSGELLEHIRMLESERADLARRADELTRLLAPAEHLAELAQELSLARARAEVLRAAAEATPLDGAMVGSGQAPGAVEIEQISRRAIAEASAQAAAELARAVQSAGSPG